MTIGTKLALGFGAVILLMVVSASVAYIGLDRMSASNDHILETAVPVVQTCSDLLGAVNHSISATRGYMIAGSDGADTEKWQKSHDEAWSDIDKRLTRLGEYTRGDISGVDETTLARVRTTLGRLRTIQNEAVDAADARDSLASQQVLVETVAPLGEHLFDTVTALVEQEAQQTMMPERGSMRAGLQDFRSYLGMALADVRAYLASGSVSHKAAYEKRWHEALAGSNTVAQNAELFSPEQRAAWNEIADAVSEFKSRTSELFSLREAEGWNQGSRFLENELVPLVRSLRTDLERMQSAANDVLEKSRSDLQSASATIQRTLLIATLLAVVLAVMIAVGLSRSMARGLQAVVVQAQAIARGDLRGDPLDLKSRDEVYDLARAFDTMKTGLRDLATQMREATENVNTSAAEIVASTQQQAAAMKEQAAAIQEITSTIEEIDESGAQIEQRARQVSTDAETASDASSKGSGAAQDANRTMQGIREQVEQVAENIVNLSERTQTIGEIVTTVTDLAEQSNLLALNASIEAVSAGDQGGRFSVVASEMKNLAEQAKSCTVQVRTILGEIQKGIHASVMLTEESVKRVEQGKQEAEVTEGVIQQMSDTTQRCVQAFEQIVGGSSQQQIGVNQVAQGMKGIRQAVEQTAAGTSQLERAASNLSALSRQLHGVASRYQL